jgi:hypothetical protein
MAPRASIFLALLKLSASGTLERLTRALDFSSDDDAALDVIIHQPHRLHESVLHPRS